MSVRNILDANGKISEFYLPAASAIDLISPVAIFPPSPYTSGVPEININGDGASEYGGSFTFNPGSNTPAGGAGVGVNIKSTPYVGATGAGVAGVSVEIGTDGATAGATAGKVQNHLYIAGTNGLSEVNDPVYNPVQLFVDANPGQTTTNPEAISVAEPYETIRTISLGNTPADYNYFKMFLDFQGVQSWSNAPDPRVRFYISNTSNGAYNSNAATTSYAQPAPPAASGDNVILEDIPLIYYGTATSNQLFLNFTYAGNPAGSIAFADPNGILTDYSIEAAKVSDM